MPDSFFYLKYKSSGFAFQDIINLDEEKVTFQREVGIFLGAAEVRYKENPEIILSRMEHYYEVARDGLVNTQVNDYASLVYFRAMAELLANYIQSFRAQHSLEPSKIVNEDIQSMPQAIQVG